MRTGYQTFPEELYREKPFLGKAYLLPWDSETFGFPVATYDIGAEQLDIEQQQQFTDLFRSWTQRNGVQLCSCSVPADSRFWKNFLPANGFKFVDVSLRAVRNDLRSAALIRSRTQLRAAVPSDWAAIEEIAANSFHHGRYHADARIPKTTADLRYRHWIRRALTGDHSIDRVYVLEQDDSIGGFYHFTVENESSDLRLAAISPKLQGSGLGFEFYLSVLHMIASLGVRRATTTISATNTAILNVFARLEFRFSKPQAIYHWHSQNSH